MILNLNLILMNFVNYLERLKLNKKHPSKKIEKKILVYNETVLTEDKCDLLIPILPKDTEYDEISTKIETLENEEDFAESDLFIVLIGCIG